MSAKASRRLRTALVVVLALTALYGAYRYTLHRMVEAKLDEIREQGYPVTLAELDKWYPQPPPDENAADVYRDAYAHNVRLGNKELYLPIVGNAKLPPRGESLPQGMRESIAQYLKTNQESIALLHKATAMPYCRVVTHLSISNTSIAPGASDRRLATHQLELEAIYAADSGAGDSAAEAIVASLGLVRQFSKEPFVTPWFAQQPYFGMASFALERVLSRTQLDSNQLASVSSALASIESSVDIGHVLLGEFAWNNDVFSEIRQGREPPGPLLTMDSNGHSHHPEWWWLLACVYRFTGLEEFDQLNYLALESKAVLIAHELLPERITALDVFEQQVRGTSALLPLSRFDSYLSCQYLRLDAKYIARLRVTQAGLSVESYRSERGQLPDALPSNLTDPFDGQPLRYKKLAKGYVVYSIGEDGKDDGGDEKKDITFTVER